MIATLSLGLLLITNTSCSKDRWNCEDGQGELVRQERSIEDFSAIKFKMAGDVIVTIDPQATTPKVEVEAQPNIQPLIDLNVSGQNLVIDNDECIRNHKKVTIYITTDDLSEVKLSGSGNVIIKNTLKTETFRASLSGSGNISGNVESNAVSCSISGSGNINLSGKTESLSVSIAGSGEYNGQELIATTAGASISGSGDIRMNVKEKLNVQIAGSGSVRYQGSPEVSKSITGSGRVRQVN